MLLLGAEEVSEARDGSNLEAGIRAPRPESSGFTRAEKGLAGTATSDPSAGWDGAVRDSRLRWLALPLFGLASIAVVACSPDAGSLDSGPSQTPDAGAADGGPQPTPDAGPQPTLDAGLQPLPDAGPMDGGAEEDCVSVTFAGSFNGRVVGDLEQCLTATQSATPVEAIPRSGFRFSAWSDGVTDNPRSLSQPRENLSLTARFETEGLTTVWLGHSFIRWNVELLFDVARNDAGYREHADWMTFSGGAGGAPGSLWANAQRRQAGETMIREQQPDNVVMTYHFLEGSSDYEDYANWVDYTLTYAPRARFYISLPWRSSPFGNQQLAPLIDENGGEDLERPYLDGLLPDFVDDVLSELRRNYPDNEFIIIPQVIAADRITKAHFDGSLTYGEARNSLLIRNPNTGEAHEHEQSIYHDGTGHPGGPLRLLTMMLYLRYIYGFEVTGYDFWENKTSFSNLGLEGIAPRETFDVPYTYYNGFDFPAVADDIFRSYGRGE